MAVRKRQRYGLTNQAFADIWNKAVSVDEVSSTTGMPKASCQSKASILRDKGLTLKKFKRGRKPTPTSPASGPTARPNSRSQIQKAITTTGSKVYASAGGADAA
jgi:hypothetical protein